MKCPQPDCVNDTIRIEGLDLCPFCDEDAYAKCKGCGELLLFEDGVDHDGEIPRFDSDCWHPRCAAEDRQAEAEIAYEAMISKTY
jgi:hypothetical protein